MSKIETRKISRDDYFPLYDELVDHSSAYSRRCKETAQQFQSKLSKNPLWLQLSPSYVEGPVGIMLDYNDMAELGSYAFSYVMLMSSMPSLSGKRIVHAGCGPGLFLSFLKETKGCSAMGVEKSRYMAEIARKKGGIDVVHGDALSLPLQNESVDAIIANHFLCHDYFNEPQLAALLRESWGALRSGGSLVAGMSSIGNPPLEESPFSKVYSYQFPVEVISGVRNIVLVK
ncbi:class I SAM-dependent methyltransferase [Candidatus Woesearchaeota archaeon]|nr:class I SAM-dependent methyltransferase [Candidatus Woesearchaeota archaeon]